MNKVISIILDILFLIVIIFLLVLGIVPNKYMILISIVLFIVGFFNTFISFKIKNKIIMVIMFIINLILFVIGSVTLYYINNTNSFFDNIKEVEENSIYYVIVSSDSKYNKLEDIESKNIGVINNYNNALNRIKDRIIINNIEYSDINNLISDLYDNKIESILLNSNNYDLYSEEEEDFVNKTKIIETIDIKIVNKIVKEDIKIDKPFNILISGIDTRGSINKVSRSDVNIVMSINPNTNKILLTSIPRDYYVKLHTYQAYDKLTHAGIYGIDESRTTIEDLLDTKIDYYIRVNFDTVINLVDFIGGVDVNSDVSFVNYNGNQVNVGINHFNGKDALAFVRERKKLAGGDRARGKHQEMVIEAIINKISTSSVLLTNYGNILYSLNDLLQTNIESDSIKMFVRRQLDTLDKWDIESISLDGYNSNNYTYSMPGWYLWVMEPDISSINNAKVKINNIMNE